jgi:hypothetical protein
MAPILLLHCWVGIVTQLGRDMDRDSGDQNIVPSTMNKNYDRSLLLHVLYLTKLKLSVRIMFMSTIMK